jgi:hypothetical protein
MVGRFFGRGDVVNEPERRKVSLAGLGLIGPGAAQDEAAAPGPGASAPAEPPKQPPADS